MTTLKDLIEAKKGEMEGVLSGFISTVRNNPRKTTTRYLEVLDRIEESLSTIAKETANALRGEEKWLDPDVEGSKVSDYKTDPVLTPLIYNSALQDIAKREEEFFGEQ